MVEGQNRLLPLPPWIRHCEACRREMKKRRIGCELGRTLKDLRVEDGMVKAVFGPSPFIAEPTPAQSKEAPIEAEAVLVTVGRAPNTSGLGLAEAGIAVDGRGWIQADEYIDSAAGVYAVGDVLGLQNHAGPCRRRGGPAAVPQLPRAGRAHGLRGRPLRHLRLLAGSGLRRPAGRRRPPLPTRSR
ncbi:MAG: FAD-dependent oxidoreductase [Bilophila sp.]